MCVRACVCVHVCACVYARSHMLVPVYGFNFVGYIYIYVCLKNL